MLSMISKAVAGRRGVWQIATRLVCRRPQSVALAYHVTRTGCLDRAMELTEVDLEGQGPTCRLAWFAMKSVLDATTESQGPLTRPGRLQSTLQGRHCILRGTCIGCACGPRGWQVLLASQRNNCPWKFPPTPPPSVPQSQTRSTRFGLYLWQNSDRAQATPVADM